MVYAMSAFLSQRHLKAPYFFFLILFYFFSSIQLPPSQTLVLSAYFQTTRDGF